MVFWCINQAVFTLRFLIQLIEVMCSSLNLMLIFLTPMKMKVICFNFKIYRLKHWNTWGLVIYVDEKYQVRCTAGSQRQCWPVKRVRSALSRGLPAWTGRSACLRMLCPKKDTLCGLGLWNELKEGGVGNSWILYSYRIFLSIWTVCMCVSELMEAGRSTAARCKSLLPSAQENCCYYRCM